MFLDWQPSLPATRWQSMGWSHQTNGGESLSLECRDGLAQPKGRTMAYTQLCFHSCRQNPLGYWHCGLSNWLQKLSPVNLFPVVQQHKLQYCFECFIIATTISSSRGLSYRAALTREMAQETRPRWARARKRIALVVKLAALRGPVSPLPWACKGFLALHWDPSP